MTVSGARVVNGFIGLAGLAFGAFFLERCDQVVRSPGDDNPIALVFVLAAALACVPAWGVVRAAAGWPLRLWRPILWLAASVVALASLAVCSLPFW